MELVRTTHAAVDLTAAVSVLDYTVAGSLPIEVMARVDLGTAGAPIAGGGTYTLTATVNGTPIEPASAVTVPPGTPRAILVGRAVPLDPGDAVSILVAGLPGDVAVGTLALLRDVTSVRPGGAGGGGTGSTAVDHNYGGTDALAYEVTLGVGIAAATIRAYLAADYAAGRTSAAFIKAVATTDANGRWETPMLLDPAAYTLVFSKPGSFLPSVVPLTVA